MKIKFDTDRMIEVCLPLAILLPAFICGACACIVGRMG